MNIRLPDWTTWSELALIDLWGDHEVMCLCTGVLPHTDNGLVDACQRKQVMAHISTAIAAGVLEAHTEQPFPDGGGYEEPLRWFRPDVFTAWAVKRFPSFPEAVRAVHAPDAGAKAQPSENSLLLGIAGMLEILKDSGRHTHNQSSIAQAIGEKGWHGASASTMEKLFAEANTAAKAAEADNARKRER